MKTLDKYIGQTVLGGILIILLILVGLFSFFEFIDEIDDIGKQRYGLWEVIQYIALEIPRYIYELFPTSALLGSLLGLGMLANHSELTVMRAAGMSIMRIGISIIKVGLVLTLISMLIGETLAPMSGQYATSMRSIAQSEHEKQQMVFTTHYGFWARDGNDFINIRTIYPDGGFGGVVLYEFDNAQHLQALTYARTTYYKDGKWTLYDMEKNLIEPTQVSRQFLKSITWDAILSPELVKIVVVRPHKLSSMGLYKYIKYLKQSGQRTAQYELAFWTRLSYPLVGMTMILLAIPFVFGSLRSVSVGQRILVGALLGVGFHMLNQTIGNIGLVYNISPMFSAFLPPLLFLVLAGIMMRRVL
ncbi:LPS export ABC transporter permease LptG [Candidatus Parabeggiatoa sp. HSG14]|uniref:LPS export ABC transporter permease LptG n=1 Tax=Candidatus Parabeggiatoa sp. HSG14 TaxID=3055593 RepID=UPI0025A7FEF0|nr:LPS export ABC transporter permease LptG [Thiotrichales bacterium HSG14]